MFTSKACYVICVGLDCGASIIAAIVNIKITKNYKFRKNILIFLEYFERPRKNFLSFAEDVYKQFQPQATVYLEELLLPRHPHNQSNSCTDNLIHDSLWNRIDYIDTGSTSFSFRICVKKIVSRNVYKFDITVIHSGFTNTNYFGFTFKFVQKFVKIVYVFIQTHHVQVTNGYTY